MGPWRNSLLSRGPRICSCHAAQCPTPRYVFPPEPTRSPRLSPAECKSTVLMIRILKSIVGAAGNIPPKGQRVSLAGHCSGPPPAGKQIEQLKRINRTVQAAALTMARRCTRLSLLVLAAQCGDLLKTLLLRHTWGGCRHVISSMAVSPRQKCATAANNFLGADNSLGTSLSSFRRNHLRILNREW